MNVLALLALGLSFASGPPVRVVASTLTDATPLTVFGAAAAVLTATLTFSLRAANKRDDRIDKVTDARLKDKDDEIIYMRAERDRYKAEAEVLRDELMRKNKEP